MSKKLLNTFLCFLLILLFIGLVRGKQKSIITKNEQPIVSFSGERQKLGKPVKVLQIRLSDVSTTVPLTITSIADNKFYAYVSQEMSEQIKNDTRVLLYRDKRPIIGEITFLSESLDRAKGLFRVEGLFPLQSELPSGTFIADLSNPHGSQSIVLPIEAVYREKNLAYTWVVKDGHCLKTYVVCGKENGETMVIQRGLEEGDLVVIQGGKYLNHKEKIHIYGEE
ncbi:MAG: hypothetical protein JW769_02210 [Parachlamydiales bacterium]|nr:hypothetical protein [Parachlamydiales bacterium]